MIVYVPVETDAAALTVMMEVPDPPADKVTEEGLNAVVRPLGPLDVAVRVMGPAKLLRLVNATLVVLDPALGTEMDDGFIDREKSGTRTVTVVTRDAKFPVPVTAIG